MAGRPNYNSRNLESATIILSVSVAIDEEGGETPPRFYSLASGDSHVIIKHMYLTKLDRVECTGNYHRFNPPAGSNLQYQVKDFKVFK